MICAGGCGKTCPASVQARTGTQFVASLCGSSECRTKHPRSQAQPPPTNERDIQRAATRDLGNLQRKFEGRGQGLKFFAGVSTGAVNVATGKPLQPIFRANLGAPELGLMSSAFRMAKLIGAQTGDSASRVGLSIGTLSSLVLARHGGQRRLAAAAIPKAMLDLAHRFVIPAAQKSPAQAASPTMPDLTYPVTTPPTPPRPVTPLPQLIIPPKPDVSSAWTTKPREGEPAWLKTLNQSDPSWFGQRRNGYACWAITLVACVWSSRCLHEVFSAATHFSAVNEANKIKSPVATAFSSLCAKNANVKVDSKVFYTSAKGLLRALRFSGHELLRQQDVMHILALTIQGLLEEFRAIKKVPATIKESNNMWKCLSRVSVSFRNTIERAACALLCGKPETSTSTNETGFVLITIKPAVVPVVSEDGPFSDSLLSKYLHASLIEKVTTVCSEQITSTSCKLLREGASAITFPDLSPLHSLLISVQTTDNIPIEFEISFQLRQFFLVFITLRSGATQHGGHYTGLALRTVDGVNKWCYINDDAVVEVVGNLLTFIEKSGMRVVGLTYESEKAETLVATDEIVEIPAPGPAAALTLARVKSTGRAATRAAPATSGVGSARKRKRVETGKDDDDAEAGVGGKVDEDDESGFVRTRKRVRGSQRQLSRADRNKLYADKAARKTAKDAKFLTTIRNVVAARAARDFEKISFTTLRQFLQNNYAFLPGSLAGSMGESLMYFKDKGTKWFDKIYLTECILALSDDNVKFIVTSNTPIIDDEDDL